jgi:hypothetical protein
MKRDDKEEVMVERRRKGKERRVKLQDEGDME